MGSKLADLILAHGNGSLVGLAGVPTQHGAGSPRTDPLESRLFADADREQRTRA